MYRLKLSKVQRYHHKCAQSLGFLGRFLLFYYSYTVTSWRVLKCWVNREKRQWTQDYLAETFNVSRQAISKWEVGSTYPDIDRLVQISNLFDITLDSLIKGDDSLKKSIVITKNAKAQTNVWEFMRSTGWMMVIAIIYLVTKMIIAVFS